MNFQFDPPEGYRNQVRFPTTPASEADFRDSMQSLLDQARDNMNAQDARGFSAVTTAARDAQTTGTQKITLGFRPKYVRIEACISNTKYMSIGTSDSAISKVLYTFNVNGNFNTGSNIIVWMHGGGTDVVQATIAFDADGFTLTWSKTGTTVTGVVDMNISALRHGE